MVRTFTLVLGILMLILSKWIINFHMKLYMALSEKMCRINPYHINPKKHPKFLKFYRIFFSILWIALSLFLIIFSIWEIF